MQFRYLQFKTDDELLHLINNDDKAAFEKIYNKYWSKLYLSAYNLLRDRYAAEDIVQEVLVQLWMKRNTVVIESLNAYLYTAVRFQVFNVIRSGKVREGLFMEIEQLSVAHVAEDNLHEKYIINKMNEEIAELPERCREIFTMSRKEHLSTKEIAERLGIAPKTVENQLTIAIRRLRSSMEHVLFWLIIFFISIWL